jgi:hypothetical protein
MYIGMLLLLIKEDYKTFSFDKNGSGKAEYSPSQLTEISDNELMPRKLIKDLITSEDFPTATGLDAYYGSRHATKSGSSGWYTTSSGNIHTGYFAETTGTGNAATASFIAKGPGAAFTNSTALQHFGANYYIPRLQNSGLLYGSNNLFVESIGANGIDFRTGTAFGSTTSRLSINQSGAIKLGTAPAVDNTATSILARDASGNLVSVDKP